MRTIQFWWPRNFVSVKRSDITLETEHRNAMICYNMLYYFGFRCFSLHFLFLPVHTHSLAEKNLHNYSAQMHTHTHKRAREKKRETSTSYIGYLVFVWCSCGLLTWMQTMPVCSVFIHSSIRSYISKLYYICVHITYSYSHIHAAFIYIVWQK